MPVVALLALLLSISAAWASHTYIGKAPILETVSGCLAITGLALIGIGLPLYH